MRIVAIVGIWNFRTAYGRLWKNFELAFAKEFPQAQFSVEYLWYSPWQRQKIRNFADSIVRKYDDGGEEVMLLGYSMGGVIATAIAPKFAKTKVRALISVFGPHTFLFGLFSWMLRSRPEVCLTPVLSFRAKFDCMVWWGSFYPRAVKHITVYSDHLFWLLFSKRPTQIVARATKKFLFPRA